MTVYTRARKWSKPYSQIIEWVRIQIQSSIIRVVSICLRKTRTIRSLPFEQGAGPQHCHIIYYLSFNFTSVHFIFLFLYRCKNYSATKFHNFTLNLSIKMVIPYNRPHKCVIYKVIPHTILSHTILYMSKRIQLPVFEAEVYSNIYLI